MTPRPLLLALALLGAAAAPAAGFHDPSFRGLTGQQRTVHLITDHEGKAEQVELVWRARCPSGFRLRLQEVAFSPSDVQSADALRGNGRIRFPDRGGRIALATTRLEGRLSGSPQAPADQVWRGTFRATVHVRRHGRFAERCALRTRWLARPEGIGEGRWVMQGGGDWVGADRLWQYDPSNAIISAKGERDRVTVDVQAHDGTPWEASFSAPALNRFVPGQRYTTDAAAPGAATMRVSGDGRGCDSGGSFAFQEIRFDRLRRLTALRVEFEQFCTDSAREGPSRGTIEWRAAR